MLGVNRSADLRDAGKPGLKPALRAARITRQARTRNVDASIVSADACARESSGNVGVAARGGRAGDRSCARATRSDRSDRSSRACMDKPRTSSPRNSFRRGWTSCQSRA